MRMPLPHHAATVYPTSWKRAKSMPTIVCAGLGPGAWEQVTLEVKSLLDAAAIIYLRTKTHPTADHLPGHLDVRTFDYLYEREAQFEEIYRQIAEELVSLALKSSEPVIYCVPGHPAIGEASVRHLRTLAREENVELKLISGLSFLEPVCTALELDPLERGLQIVDGTELASITSGDNASTNNPKSKHPQAGTQNPKSEEPFL